jgi:hypothetical protein
VWSGAAIGLAAVGFSIWRVAGQAGQRSYVLRHSILPVAAAAATVAVVVLADRWKRREGRWGSAGTQLCLVALPAVVAIESLAFVVPYLPRTPKAQFYPTPPAVRFLQANLQEDRVASSRRVLLPGTSTFYELRSVTSHTFQESNWHALLKVGNAGRAVGTVYTRLLPLPQVAASPVLDLLGARYFVTDPSDPVFGVPVASPPPAGTVLLRPANP